MSTSRILAVSFLCICLKLAIYAILAGGDPAPALCRWDCGWYDGIAGGGYAATSHVNAGRIEHAWSFFPVMPLLIAGARRLFRLDVSEAAMAVSSLCLPGVAVFGARYRDATRRAPRDLTWVLLVAVMPFGFYFATGYSEAPYALFAFATLLALSRRRMFAASVSSALLSATRPTGIWLAPAIGVLALGRAARAPTPASRAVALLPALIAVAGLLAWMSYLAVTVGDPLAFVHSQSGWGGI